MDSLRPAVWIAAGVLLLSMVGCQPPIDPRVHLGDLVITGSSGTAPYTDLVAIHGSLVIRGTTHTTFDFPSLRTVAGDVLIERNAQLRTLVGLNKLIWIGGDLRVEANDSLSHLAGVNSLLLIEGDLRVLRNARMETLDGLERLSEIGGTVSFRDNPEFRSFTALRNLRSIGGDILIHGHPNLTSLSGLDPAILHGDTDIKENLNLHYSEVHSWREELRKKGWAGESRGTDFFGLLEQLNSQEDREPTPPPPPPPPPTPRPDYLVVGRLEVKGGHDRKAVEAKIGQHRSQIRFCFERAHFKGGDARGELSLAWTIGVDGYVQDPRTKKSNLAEPTIANCIAQRVRRWYFGEARHPSEVVQSWSFHPPK